MSKENQSKDPNASSLLNESYEQSKSSFTNFSKSINHASIKFKKDKPLNKILLKDLFSLY